MKNIIDLRKCKNGDLLISKHGMILIYGEHRPESPFPHCVIYPTHGKATACDNGTRLDDGRTFRNRSLPTDHDIVAVIRSGAILQETVLE